MYDTKMPPWTPPMEISHQYNQWGFVEKRGCTHTHKPYLYLYIYISIIYIYLYIYIYISIGVENYPKPLWVTHQTILGRDFHSKFISIRDLGLMDSNSIPSTLMAGFPYVCWLNHVKPTDWWIWSWPDVAGLDWVNYPKMTELSG